MVVNVLRDAISPAEGENSVRIYHCTTLTSRLLRLNAEGYLWITNKRLIFYAFGTSYQGKSIFLSEVPIADISGITSFKGTYFSFSHFILAVVASFVASQIINVVAGLVTGLLIRDFQTIQTLYLIIPAAVVIGSLFVPRESIWRPVLAASGVLMAVTSTGLNIFGSLTSGFGNPRGLSGFSNVSGLISILIPFAFFYALLCTFWYARRETMSLAVGSKGGSSTPIAISGISGFGLHSGAAIRALSAEPAPDAEVMIKELGAVITDIQVLGDLGIQKWSQPSASSSSYSARK